MEDGINTTLVADTLETLDPLKKTRGRTKKAYPNTTVATAQLESRYPKRSINK